jgi:hypothetical protein
MEGFEASIANLMIDFFCIFYILIVFGFAMGAIQ